MESNMGLRIIGTGHAAPERVVTNDDMSRLVETNDQWIRERTGIERRHFAQNETNVDMAYQAATQAITASGITLEDIGLCIVATFSPDMQVPSEACLLQKRLGLKRDIPCFDINAACSGFLYGLQVAYGLMMTSDKKYALVVGSEIISKRLNMQDRGTCILFGDGAGAAVVELACGYPFYGMMGADGDDKILVCGQENSENPFVEMDGQAVFKFAVSTIPKCIQDVLEHTGVSLDDIDYIVCHQANKRIIEFVAKKMKQPIEKFYMDLQEYGNTSAASIPIALSEMDDAGMLKEGTKVICVGFGAGFTWGAALLQW